MGEIFFGVDEAIGDLAGEKGGGNGADGSGQSQNPSNLRPGETQPALVGFPHQIVRQIGEPDAPDGVLEEHHEGEREFMLSHCAHANCESRIVFTPPRFPE
jgi:hypothetical protein